MATILEVEPSPRQGKRFRVMLSDGRRFDFGAKGGSCYLDHGDPKLRAAYWARHTANPTEKRLIAELIPSPALYSAYLLWGGSTTSLGENVDALNQLMVQKN
jgi:hypothetical protein